MPSATSAGAKVTVREFTSRQNELLAALSDLTDLKAQFGALLAEYEAHLPLTGAEGPEPRLVTQAVRARAKQINERAAARVVDVRPAEPATESSPGTPVSP